MNILKRVLMIICIIVFLCINKSLAVTGTVKASAIRVREKPNTTSSIITNVYENDIVEILETDGDWCKIKSNNGTGYVKKEFLAISSQKKTSANNNDVSNSKETKNTVNTTSNNINENTSVMSENNIAENTTNNEETQNNTEIKYTTNTAVSLRLLPSMSSKAILQLEGGKQITKLLEISNWIKVTDGSLQGWVNKAKITENTSIQNSVSPKEEINEEEIPKEQPKETTSEKPAETNTNKNGKVKVETAKVRKTPSTSADIVGTLDYYDDVTIVSEEGDWYKITAKGISGYISKSLVTVKVSSRGLTENRKEDTSVINEEANKEVTAALSNNENEKKSQSSQVVDYAKQFLGTSYVSGGKTPESGFDCSGFTKYVFSNFGYSLGNTAASQNNLGKEVARDSMRPGDLILFYDEGKSKIGHTGIYVGDGNFVHAANASRGVVTDNLNTNSYYNSRFITAKRIVE